MKLNWNCLIWLLIPGLAMAATPPQLPTTDKSGSADSPFLKRYDGSVILSYDKSNFDEMTFPLSKLEPVAGTRDNHNNAVFAPQSKKVVSGATTHVVYVSPSERSSLEVMRHFESQIKGRNGTTVYQCQAPNCGGSATGNRLGGGGTMGLPMYLRSGDKVTEKAWSLPWCSAHVKLVDLRYMLAQVPGALVSVYTAKMPDASGDCTGLHNRTLAVVDIVQTTGTTSSVAPVVGNEIDRALTRDGHVALDGIEFEPGKATLGASSDPAMQQIAQLLTNDSKRKLMVVAHVDSGESIAKDTDISKKRANAVVTRLINKHKINRARLTAIGIGSAAPLMSNRTPEGRAKNRRVELVEY